MNIFRRTLLLSFVLILVSCVESGLKTEVEQEDNVTDTVITITEDSYMADNTITKAHGNLGKYDSFFDKSDFTIGISSFRINRFGENRAFAFCSPNGMKHSDSGLAESILINGRAVFSMGTKAGDESVLEMFGRNVSFDFPGMELVTKGPNGSGIQLYAPRAVEISFPAVQSKGYPVCFHKNFVVRWNKDVENENGVLVIIKWSGTVLFGKDYASSVVHSKQVPDTGTANLEEAMFEGIPDTALCSLYLLRGDIQNVEVAQMNYQLLAETHDELDFVLVRNIAKISGR